MNASKFRPLSISTMKNLEFGELTTKKKNTSHSMKDLSSFLRKKRSWGALERCR